MDEQEPKEIKLDIETDERSSSAEDWNSLLEELESTPRRQKAPPEKAPEGQTPPADAQPSTPEQYLTKAISEVEEAQDELQKFVKDHPYLVAPNVHNLWGDALKETAYTMTRQRDALLGRSPSEGEEPS